MLSTNDFIVATTSTKEGHRIKKILGLRCAKCGGLMDIECKSIVDGTDSIAFLSTRSYVDYVTERTQGIRISACSSEPAQSDRTGTHATYWKCINCNFERRIS